MKGSQINNWNWQIPCLEKEVEEAKSSCLSYYKGGIKTIQGKNKGATAPFPVSRFKSDDYTKCIKDVSLHCTGKINSSKAW